MNVGKQRKVQAKEIVQQKHLDSASLLIFSFSNIYVNIATGQQTKPRKISTLISILFANKLKQRRSSLPISSLTYLQTCEQTLADTHKHSKYM